jgi:hypothetical protein
VPIARKVCKNKSALAHGWIQPFSQCAIYYPHPYTSNMDVVVYCMHIDCKHENLGANDNDLIKTDSK